MPRRRGALRSWVVLALLGLAAIGYFSGGEGSESPGPAPAGRAGDSTARGGDATAPRRGERSGDEANRSKPSRKDGGANALPAAPGAGAVPARLVRVVDGDTIEVVLGGRSEAVRYIGVDTPETVAPGTPVQCGGPAATAANRRLLRGRRLVLSFGPERRDRYGRLLAYVRAGRALVNERLITLGLARSLAISPNTELASRFARLERQAARRGTGMWGSCG